MIFIVLIFVLIASLNAKTAPAGRIHQDYTAPKRTTMICGLMAFFMLLNICKQYVELKGTFDAPFLAFDAHIGQLRYAPLLFYFGFELMEMFSKEGKDFLRTMPKKRLLTLLADFSAAILIYLIVRALLGKTYSVPKVLLSFIGWESVGNSSWVVFAFLIFMVLFFVSMQTTRLFKKSSKLSEFVGAMVLLILTAVFVCISVKLGRPDYSYNIVLMLPLGSLYSVFRTDIERVVTYNRFTYILSVVLALLFYMFYFPIRSQSVIYYIFWQTAGMALILLFTMKVSLGNAVLEWFGDHALSLFIFQRLSMIVLEHFGLNKSNKVVFIIFSIALTCLLAEIFDIFTGKLNYFIVNAGSKNKSAETMKSEVTGLKNHFLQLLPGIIICFVTCYMFFIFEPITMYCSNINDFWFDFNIMLVQLLKIFGLFFVLSSAVVVLLYLILHKKKNGLAAYHKALIAFSIVFILMYIQGNYMAGALPVIDGSDIDWSRTAIYDVITLAVIAALTAGAYFLQKRKGLRFTVKLGTGISLAVFAMINVSLVSTASQSDCFKEKDRFIPTFKNFSTVSSDKNFFIFTVDSVNCDDFTELVLNDPKYKSLFNDFTYYDDACSVHPVSRDSLCLILSGKLNNNTVPFAEFSSNALNDSKLFNSLTDKNYSINLYSNDIIWQGKKDFEISNTAGSKNVVINSKKFFDEIARYVSFRYLPYSFKSIPKIADLDFDKTFDNKYAYSNKEIYRYLKENDDLKVVSDPQFKFIHIQGAHTPYNIDESLNSDKNGNYSKSILGTAAIINNYLEILKDNGTYDNSVIVIMGDHGHDHDDYTYKDNYILSKFKPLLMIKGIDEHHDLNISDSPISYIDLEDAFLELLDGKSSTGLFEGISSPRTRKVLCYKFKKEDHMVEYATEGKANEWDKFYETGNVYDLK